VVGNVFLNIIMMNVILKPSVEERSNISTPSLRVEGGDKKGTQCLGL
jgi:hypothetical protein